MTLGLTFILFLLGFQTLLKYYEKNVCNYLLNLPKREYGVVARLPHLLEITCWFYIAAQPTIQENISCKYCTMNILH